MSDRRVSLTVSMDSNLWDEIDQEAENQNTSRSEIVRRSWEAYKKLQAEAESDDK